MTPDTTVADPVRASTRRAAGAFLRRDLQVNLSYKLPFALELLGIVLTLITFRFVSRLVDPGRVPGGYFAFVTVGLAFSSFFGAISVVAGNLREEQLTGTLESTLSCGLPIPALAVGISAYPMIAAAFSATVYVIAGAFMGLRAPGANWPLAVTSLVLGSTSFAGVGLGGAALVLIVKRAAGATGWLVAFLTLVAGEFFPPQLLPGWMQWVGNLSPFTITLKIGRAATLQGASWSDQAGGLAVLVVMSVAYAAVGIAAIGFGLRWAKRRGTLAGY